MRFLNKGYFGDIDVESIYNKFYDLLCYNGTTFSYMSMGKKYYPIWGYNVRDCNSGNINDINAFKASPTILIGDNKYIGITHTIYTNEGYSYMEWPLDTLYFNTLYHGYYNNKNINYICGHLDIMNNLNMKRDIIGSQSFIDYILHNYNGNYISSNKIKWMGNKGNDNNIYTFSTISKNTFNKIATIHNIFYPQYIDYSKASKPNSSLFDTLGIGRITTTDMEKFNNEGTWMDISSPSYISFYRGGGLEIRFKGYYTNNSDINDGSILWNDGMMLGNWCPLDGTRSNYIYVSRSDLDVFGTFLRRRSYEIPHIEIDPNITVYKRLEVELNNLISSKCTYNSKNSETIEEKYEVLKIYNINPPSHIIDLSKDEPATMKDWILQNEKDYIDRCTVYEDHTTYYHRGDGWWQFIVI